MIRLCLVSFALLLALPLAADETQRGGSLSLEPGVFLPTGRLATEYGPAPQAALDFDIGINPKWSFIFGAAYSDHENTSNPYAGLVLAPGWMGIKSKAQFADQVEVFWDLSGELAYEKEFLYNTGSGSVQNVDGGCAVGAGFDLWLTHWLLLGCESRCHLIVEDRQVFPFMQLALRLGLRG